MHDKEAAHDCSARQMTNPRNALLRVYLIRTCPSGEDTTLKDQCLLRGLGKRESRLVPGTTKEELKKWAIARGIGPLKRSVGAQPHSCRLGKTRVNLTSQKDNLVICRNVELSIPESHIWSVQNRRGSRRCRLSRWDVRARARRWGGSRYSRTLCAQRVRGGAHSFYGILFLFFCRTPPPKKGPDPFLPCVAA